MSEAQTAPEGLDFDTADRLRKALRFADVSVQEMANELGMSRNSIGRYINGHIHPDLRTMRIWSWKTGVPLDWLQGEESASGSNITRIMGDQSIDNEITSHARRIDALREQLHGPSRRGPIRRSPLGDTSVIPSAVQASGG